LSDIRDMVIEVRDLVDLYEDAITRIKLAKLDVRMNLDKLNELLPLLESAINRTSKFFEKYVKLSYDESSYYGRYLKVYCNYLLLVSMPYLRDLLNEIINTLSDESNKHMLQELSAHLSRLLDMYGNRCSSTLHHSNESSP